MRHLLFATLGIAWCAALATLGIACCAAVALP